MVMHGSGCTLSSLVRNIKRLDLSEPVTVGVRPINGTFREADLLRQQCLAPRLTRGFATPTDLPTITTPINIPGSRVLKPPRKHINPNVDLSLYAPPQLLTTIHSWPSLEPQRYAWYESDHLGVPLRRDLLHRAVIFEADNKRTGAAHMPHRTEMIGSKRKLHKQKGTGRARVGDRFSPIREGGARAHGPRKERSFATELQRKIYDKAWRIALSHRYRLGELVVVGDQIGLQKEQGTWFLKNFLEQNQWGKRHGRCLFISGTNSIGPAMEELADHGALKTARDVDVKDLLSMGRLVIEQRILNRLLQDHSSDLSTHKRLPTLGRSKTAKFSNVGANVAEEFVYEDEEFDENEDFDEEAEDAAYDFEEADGEIFEESAGEAEAVVQPTDGKAAL
ncbi:54S ribosomal protein yml6, mitochondrial [Cyphellophora attinorum]|uniref:Large ribosomal subunit protein uL4m n=1 Tax=Cyphellophora attinorum TaxID=1664694 RepID=A0A0N0NKE8_9EURO|nr:54S ribosomal protein yml6, mitochondrial [Phialophora attinorum]KPI38061.1 54S ribosomal protein yml6, mitochondrial [Phialophora attinorum]